MVVVGLVVVVVVGWVVVLELEGVTTVRVTVVGRVVVVVVVVGLALPLLTALFVLEEVTVVTVRVVEFPAVELPLLGVVVLPLLIGCAVLRAGFVGDSISLLRAPVTTLLVGVVGVLLLVPMLLKLLPDPVVPASWS